MKNSFLFIRIDELSSCRQVMLTRSEKEKLVMHLYEQGKTIREISKAVHMSFSDIGGIIRKYAGEEKAIDQKPLSKNTQALKLFHEGKSPVEVAIELDMSPMEITDTYNEYLQLNKMYDFIMTYRRIKDDFPSFLKLYNTMKNRGIGENDVINFIQLSSQTVYLHDYYNMLVEDVRKMEIQKNSKREELKELDKEIEDAYNKLEYLKIKWKEYNDFSETN